MTSDENTGKHVRLISGAEHATPGMSYQTTETSGGNRELASEVKPFEFLTSQDFNDPTLGQVLAWHSENCAHCALGAKLKPPVFGTHDIRHCAEYYEIVQEYSDYERDYVSRGNP